MPTPPETKADVVLSYVEPDQAWARWIAAQLQAERFRCVLPEQGVVPGSDFLLSYEQARTVADRVLIVLSPEYLAAFAGALPSRNKLKAMLSQPPSSLLAVNVRGGVRMDAEHLDDWTDLVGLPEKTARERLLGAIRRVVTTDRVSPPFPGRQIPSRTESASASSLRGRAPRPAPQGLKSPPTAVDHLITNLPAGQPHFLVGRSTLLTRLSALLKATDGSEADGTVSTVVLVGPDGIGKSTVARAYARANVSRYELIWWIRAGSPETLSSDLLRLADALGIHQSPLGSPGEAIAAAIRHLEEHEGWLLVFDDARAPEDLVSYRPSTDHGHILITTISDQWSHSTLSVGPFSEAEALDLLAQSIGKGDEPTARALAAELGYYPLSLGIVARSSRDLHLSLSHYRDALARTRHRDDATDNAEGGFHQQLGAICHLLLPELAQPESAAGDLLSLGAFLAPTGIPPAILTGSEVQPDSAASPFPLTPTKVGEVISRLQAAGLIEVDESSLTFHPVVQEVIRTSLGDEQRRRWAEIATNLIASTFQFDRNNPATWGAAYNLLPHVIAVTAFAQLLDVALEPAGRLLNLAGLALEAQGQWSEAKRALNRALLLAERVYGPEHLNVAIVLSNLGLAYRRQGELTEAEEHARRALALAEAFENPAYPALALIISNLAALTGDLGQRDEARSYLERLLRFQHDAGDQRAECSTLFRLAMLDQEDQKRPAAREKAEQILAIQRELGDRLGEANALEQLASLDIQAGTDLAARPQLELAVSIRQEVGEWAGAVPALYQLGLLDLKDGDDELAAERFTHCLAIQQAQGDQVGEAQTWGQLGYLGARHQGLGRAIRLVALSYLIYTASGRPEAEGAFQALLKMGSDLSLSPETLAGQLAPAVGEYQRDRGWAMVREALADLPTYPLPLRPDPGYLSHPTYSIVVVTYNSEREIGDCLRSIEQASRGVWYEVVIVDNASTDQTVAEIQAFAEKHPHVTIKLIVNGRNVGYAAAANQGIDQSVGSYLAIVHPDATVASHWLTLLTSHVGPDVGAVGPITDYRAGFQHIDSHYPGFISAARSGGEMAAAIRRQNHGRATETKLLLGFCILVPRSVIDAVGLFDPDLYLGYEDVDYAWRLRSSGYRLLVAGDVFVRHVGRASFRDVSERERRRWLQNSRSHVLGKIRQHDGVHGPPSPIEIFGAPWLDDVEADAAPDSQRRPDDPLPAALFHQISGV
jgi:GT2 family glycosyltransferase/tetratricopeptide (TPR) repeat protein